MTRDTFLSLCLGAVFGLGLLCHAQAQTPGPAADYQATSAIEADDDMALPDERAIEATAAIPAVATGQDAASAMASVPTTLIGRWTIKSVRTKDNILKKVQKLLLNPAVLTLRQDGQFTMTAGCAHNTGTIRWSEEQFSLGMVLREERKCNRAQRELEEQILNMLNQVSQLRNDKPDQVLFQDESGQDLITLSRAN